MYAFVFSPLSLKKNPTSGFPFPSAFSLISLSFKQFFLLSHLLLLLSSLAIHSPPLSFFLLLSSPFFVFIAKRNQSPPCLVLSRRRRETRLPYPYRVRWSVVCRARSGHGLYSWWHGKGNGLVRVLWASGRGKRRRITGKKKI